MTTVITGSENIYHVALSCLHHTGFVLGCENCEGYDFRGLCIINLGYLEVYYMAIRMVLVNLLLLLLLSSD